MGMFHDLRAWQNYGSIESALSLSHAASMHMVIMDTKYDPDVKVEIAVGKQTKFVLNDIGLHVHDVRNNAEVPSSSAKVSSSNNTK